MSLERNILANYIGAGTAMAAPILALPLYLAALGPEQFGFVGFVTMLQAVLNLLDSAMSQALVREVSLRINRDGTVRLGTATLLYSYERIYWVSAVAISTGVALLAGPIVRHWLQLDDASSQANGHAAVWGAAAIFITLFPGSLYRSFLVGLQHQVDLNKILVAATLIRHGGAVLAITLWPFLIVYLIWHVLAGALETTLRARAAWSATGIRRAEAHWQGDLIRQSWPGMACFTAASGFGALAMQLDKVLLSKLVPLADFGYYVIASSAAAGVLQLIYPLMQAVLPYALQLKDDKGALRRLYGRIFALITFVALLGLCVYVTSGQWLLSLWLRDPKAATTIYPLLGWLLVGAIVNAFYNVGYANWIVHAKIARILAVNLLTGLLCILIIPTMVSHFGIIGATSGWLIINVLGFMASLPELLRIRK